jgi:hypothetical protein
MILAPLAALFLAGVLPDTRADDLPVFVGLDSSTNEPIMAFDPETWVRSLLASPVIITEQAHSKARLFFAHHSLASIGRLSR